MLAIRERCRLVLTLPIINKTNTIRNDFNTLTQKDSSVEEVANFINNNIANASKEDASKMVDGFEKIRIQSQNQGLTSPGFGLV